MRRSQVWRPKRVSTPVSFQGWCSGCSAARSTRLSPTTSGLSLLIAASVGALSGGDPVRHAALAACVTLMIASIALMAWLVRAGSAVGFFSETVLVGFKVGLAFYLASTQLPELFGFKGTQRRLLGAFGVFHRAPE